jgi:uncharacterized repeat protein (TIGR03803 family)
MQGTWHAIILAFCLLAAPISTQPAHAQTLSVLHNFTGAADGGNPYSGLSMDQAGNLYGTTVAGGAGSGTVFQLKHSGGGYVFNPLHSFRGANDGIEPLASVTLGSDGSLYGTTARGGDSAGNGTVFKLRPPTMPCRSALCAWTETVLYRFQGGSDGSEPNYGDLIFDSAGAIYGATIVGGTSNQGTVYKLTLSGNQWTESLLYTFAGGTDGGQPFAGMVFDQAGNLFSTAQVGGTYGFGTIYELAPSGSQWVEQTLYSFRGTDDGGTPVSAPLVDASDNLIGTTCSGGTPFGGTAYELSPMGNNWSFTLLQSFSHLSCPWPSLTKDNAGNLYGVTVNGGSNQSCPSPLGCGTIYKLSPVPGGYMYSDLHDFDGTDGQNPYGRVVIDSVGNLYGTASIGGSSFACSLGCGVVWQLRP